jgi:predicted peptidase
LLKDEGVNRDSDTAVLLAGLFETKSADKSLLSNSPPAMDRAWWAGLKKKIGEPVIKHLIYLPPAYDKAPDQQWPLVLFLHGKGERGDNLDQIKEAALPSRLEYDNGFRRQFPAIVVAPQCPAGEWWSTNELAALLDEVQGKYRIDPNRVYVTGMSMGGYGTWALATAFPDRFAAIAPVCGGGDPAEFERLAHMPIWAFHGRKDDIVPYAESQRMITLLETVGADVKLTTYPNARHDAWTETYANPELYTWLFSHTRSTHSAQGSAPLVAGTVAPTTLPSR